MAVHCNLSTLMGRKRYSIQDVHILTGLSRSSSLLFIHSGCVEQIDIIHSFCGMLLSAIHEEEGEEKLHLLMVDDHIPAGAKLY